MNTIVTKLFYKVHRVLENLASYNSVLESPLNIATYPGMGGSHPSMPRYEAILYNHRRISCTEQLMRTGMAKNTSCAVGDFT